MQGAAKMQASKVGTQASVGGACRYANSLSAPTAPARVSLAGRVRHVCAAQQVGAGSEQQVERPRERSRVIRRENLVKPDIANVSSSRSPSSQGTASTSRASPATLGEKKALIRSAQQTPPSGAATAAKLRVTPRLSIHRSNQNISVQVIDDSLGYTLATASTNQKDLREVLDGKGGNLAAAQAVGVKIAKLCLKRRIQKVALDYGELPYIGRVQALADAARGAGLELEDYVRPEKATEM